MTKERHASIGPTTVANYSVRDYKPWPTGIKSEDVWRIVGPTVEYHMSRVPLWKVFTACYVEGLLHGMQMAQLQSKTSTDTPNAP